MDLMEAIEICRQEKALTDRTADLCSVIRSYRNLIHPGRLIRPGEPAPDKDSATIAVTLVRIIAEELAATREKAVGLTAAIDMAVQNRLDAWIKQYVSQGDDAADKLEVVRGMRLLVDIPF